MMIELTAKTETDTDTDKITRVSRRILKREVKVQMDNT